MNQPYYVQAPFPAAHETNVYGIKKSRGVFFKISVVVLCLIIAATTVLSFFNRRRTVAFSEMVYERPDADAIIELIGEIGKMVEDGAGFGETSKKYIELDALVADYKSQYSLAYIKYAMNVTDEELKKEIDFFGETQSLLTGKIRELHYTIAGSALEDEFEKRLLGEGFFDDYRGENLYDDEVVAANQRISELVTEYYDMMSDLRAEHDGKEMTLEEIIEERRFGKISYMDYISFLDKYYTKYNSLAGEIYIEMVKLRKKVAEKLGYASYEELASEDFGREYGVEDIENYCRLIETELIPLYKEFAENGEMEIVNEIYDISENRIWEIFDAATRNLGGSIRSAYTFMRQYGLADITPSDTKVASSFTMYISNYDAPFVMVNSDMTSKTLITTAHEFGHFNDNYVNMRDNNDLDVAETLSQSMEFLLLDASRSEMESDKVEFLLKQNVMDTFCSLCVQAAYRNFEARVYALGDDELTLENINRIALECFRDTHSGYRGFEDLLSKSWFGIGHFFEVPFYTISYAASAGAALQIYSHIEEGDALEIYNTITSSSSSGGNFVKTVTDAGLENPFKTESVERLKNMLKNENLFGGE